MNGVDVVRWAADNALAPIEVDCATAVMLKIIDGKCKMSEAEKQIMAQLYDAVKARSGLHLSEDIHCLIAASRQVASEATKLHIYEKRVLAETMISRPAMKGFKARLREAGLFGPELDEEAE